MKILWIPNFLPFPADNGGKVVIANRIKYLSNSNEIYLVAEKNRNEDRAKDALEKYCKQYVLVEKQPKTKIDLLFWFLSKSLNVGRLYNPNITEAIRNIIINTSIDLINIDLPQTAIVLEPLKDLIKDIPIVINEHNIEFLNVKSKLSVKGLNPFIKLYALFEYKKLCSWEKKLYSWNNINSLVFLSENDKNNFDRYFGLDGFDWLISPIGTNEIENGQGIMDIEKGAIVFPASFDYHPNYHGALWFAQNVFPKIESKISSAKLYIVGRNPVKEIQGLCRENIIVTGTVDSMTPYLEKAEIFIVPIFFGGGVKTKLIEMGLYGKGVVSTKEGIMGTLFKHNEDVLVTNDPDEFASYCISLLKDGDDFIAMKKNLIEKTKRNYLWENIMLDYQDFLNRGNNEH